MDFEHILVERDAGGRVAIVTLNRPKVLNALSPALVAELGRALAAAAADPEVGAAVVTGGPRVFAAGADIGDMAERTAAEQLLRDAASGLGAAAAFPKPLVAAVNGWALGGGCELALMCDVIVAGDGAGFGQPEINLGVIPGAGGTQRWARTAGKHVAMEAVLGGRPIGAQRAYQLGMVNRVVPAEVTVRVATEIAADLAAKAPIAARLAKDAVNQALETPLSGGLAAERRNFYFLFSTEDQKEGMRAFLGKRTPEFKGR